MNLEYLGRVVFNKEGLLYPDSVVGTDSHTTMINGLGIVGWGEWLLLADWKLVLAPYPNQPQRESLSVSYWK